MKQRRWIDRHGAELLMIPGAQAPGVESIAIVKNNGSSKWGKPGRGLWFKRKSVTSYDVYSKALLPSQAWFAEKTQVSVHKEKALGTTLCIKEASCTQSR